MKSFHQNYSQGQKKKKSVICCRDDLSSQEKSIYYVCKMFKSLKEKSNINTHVKFKEKKREETLLYKFILHNKRGKSK